MKIESIILTNEEMNDAISKWLKWHNLHVEIESVEPKGYPRKGWEVGLKADDVPEVVTPSKPEPQLPDVMREIVNTIRPTSE